MTKLRATAVSYLNTKPLLYGLVSNGFEIKMDLQLDIPSVCARKLKEGTVDIGLVPVAVIPELETPYIISDYCIGSVGAVNTVCIYGDCPIEEMEELYLDHHSRTSVELSKILIRDYWKLDLDYLPAQEGYIDQIGGKRGGLVIGDRTIGLDQKFPFVYDLGEYWQLHTGLPFVFAAWVSNKPLAPSFVNSFNKALADGIAHIPQLIYLIPPPAAQFDLEYYFTHHISYQLDADKRKALALFLESMNVNIQPSLEPALLM